MTKFINYWRAYASETEAQGNEKSCWSKESLIQGIVKEALIAIGSLIQEKKDVTSKIEIEELGTSLLGIKRHLYFNGTRFSIIAIDSPDQVSMPELCRVLTDKSREAICLCILPSLDMSVWPLAGENTQVGAATIIPLYPVDVDALGMNHVSIFGLIEYKLFRRLILDKPDAGTQFETRLVREFLLSLQRAVSHQKTSILCLDHILMILVHGSNIPFLSVFVVPLSRAVAACSLVQVPVVRASWLSKLVAHSF